MFGFKKKENKQPQVDTAIQQPASKPVERKVPELTTFMCTAVGNRKYQQDQAYVTKSKPLAANKKTRVLALVCDGMGGMADGGRASETAVAMMKAGFEKIEKMPSVNIPAFFQQGIVAIDKKIAEFPKENGRGSGTTMVACIAEDDNLYFASVGDSRIYYIRNGKLNQLTRDHNYELRLQQMADAGQISQEQVKTHRQKEALISFLGIGNVSLMDIRSTPIKMQYGDVVMLCSDGVTKTLSDEQIELILTEDKVKPEQKAEALVNAATTANSHSQDNTTVALIHYQEKDIKKISS